MKKRNINRERYPSKWEEFKNKYGEEEATEYYFKFSRSFCLEKYILKYGEEGEKIYNKKKSKIKRGMSLELSIKRHGEEKGKIIYERWKKEVKQDKENFIKRYGEKEGEIKYNKFKDKCMEAIKRGVSPKNRNLPTKLSYWIEKCDGNIEEAKEKLKDRQTTSTLDKLIKKHGKIEGPKKYQEINKKKAFSIENYIEKYGDIKGPEKYYQIIEKMKYSHSKESYIEKYGKIEGVKKYQEINKKRRENNKYINRQSIIGLEFSESLNSIICDNFEKIYFGDKEYKFFIWDDNINIAVVDFYIKDINVIIEFYGDYWHRNPKKYNDEISIKIRKKDQKRIDSIVKKFGSKVLIVWEDKYREDRKKVLDEIVKCLNI